jgi:hypothetical protein
LQVSNKVTELPEGNKGIARPLLVKLLTESEPGQLAPPVFEQVRLVQARPALGMSRITALFAQAGPALLAVMVYCVVLPAAKLLTPLVLLKLKLAGAMMAAVCVAESTELSVLRRVEVSAALLVTVPVVLADTVALTVIVTVVAGERLKAEMGKLSGEGQLPMIAPLLVALQLTLPNTPPAEMVSATVTLVAVSAGLLLLITMV